MARLKFDSPALKSFLTAAAIAGAIGGCGSSPARHASRTLQTSLMDDQLLLYDSPAQAGTALQAISALGVDQVKVSLVWSLVAPDPTSTRRPGFDATDPAAYPPGAWTRYDRIVAEAHRLGLKVSFLLVPPSPAWAIPASNYRQGEALGHAPNPADFGQFVQAAARRYSGSYQGLPRVSSWEIWNEPNFPAWLNPFTRRMPGGGTEYLQPALYRGLVNAAWRGLQAGGHTPSTDTILIGETVSPGVLTGAQFDRGLYCVGSDLRPLRGSAAAAYGCPRAGSSTSFVNSNPALFDASGFAYHPYSFDVAPNVGYPLAGWITMHNLSSLAGLLDGAFKAYGALPAGGVPIYLTEFGYESDPPDPYVTNSTAQQAAWLNEAEFMAWNDGYVRSFNQFELIDSAPRAHTKPGSRAYWATFQTGLEFLGGRPKPALPGFRLPIWLPDPRHGSSVPVWGQLRPADHSGTQRATIQYRTSGSRNWSSQGGDAVSTKSQEGFFYTSVPIPSAGWVRLAWTDPSDGATYYSRSARIR